MKPEGVSSVTEGRSLAGDGAKCDTEQTFGLTDGIPPGPMKKGPQQCRSPPKWQNGWSFTRAGAAAFCCMRPESPRKCVHGRPERGEGSPAAKPNSRDGRNPE